MKQKIRTFVAVPISETLRRAAVACVDRFRATGADVKWVAPENLHVTVKFLGDVDATKIHEVCRTIEESVSDLACFDLQIQGAGAFPDIKRPRTIWLGAGEGANAITELAKRLERGLEAIGYPRERRRFHPHVTLGRARHAGPALADLAESLRDSADIEIGRCRISEVVTFASQLGRDGPTYEALARAQLLAK
jgi:2'-5' RNA ligase